MGLRSIPSPRISSLPTDTSTTSCSGQFASIAAITAVRSWHQPCTNGRHGLNRIGPWSDDMLKQMTARLALAAAVTIGASGTAFAQQTLNFNIGYFSILGEDA